MTIEQLGSLGEFVSSIAVVVSLIYLAVQVRHNSVQVQENVKALKRSEMNETMRGYSNLRSLVIGSDNLSDLIVRGRANPELLSESEKHRVLAHLSEFIWLNYHVWSRVRDGYMDSGDWKRGQNRAIARIVGDPLGREAWETCKEFLDEDYVRAAEENFGAQGA